MDVAELRRTARTIMSAGSAAALLGIGIMVHGEMEFGDVILVGGLVALAIGSFLLARTPMGDNNVD